MLVNRNFRALVADPKIQEKWDSSGYARRHRGSTFVAHVVPDSPLHRLGLRIQEDVISSGLRRDYGLLPPSSFHMTVVEGLKGPQLHGQEGRWPSWLKDAADFPNAVQRMLARLSAAHIPGPQGLEMTPAGVYPLQESLTVALVPASDQVREELERFRFRVSEVLEIPYVGLDVYRFHMSLGYRLTEADVMDPMLAELTARYSEWTGEIGRADLEDVAFNVFDDMLAFPPLMYFRPQE